MIRLFGIGSPHGDDQVGWRLIEAVISEGWPGVCAIPIARPTDLPDHLGDGGPVVVIDACDVGEAPGTVLVRRWPDTLEHRDVGSSHGLGPCEVLLLLESLGRLPQSVTLFLVQAGTTSPTGGLSQALLGRWPEILEDLRRLVFRLDPTPEDSSRRAWQVQVRGRVQGVGFRPYIARLAAELGLSGSVRNTTAGVVIHIEGDETRLERFGELLPSRHPPAAEILSIEIERRPPLGCTHFEILPSEAIAEGISTEDGVRAVVAPDLAACAACLEEFDQLEDRRFRYGLTSCTDCGPRFSIQSVPPFDRERTTMMDFPPCDDCLREYADPANRRFHAQNIACPRCGPRLWLEPAGSPPTGPPEDADDRRVLAEAAERLKAGQVLAVKGIGGFHLLCDATSAEAVAALRRRKKRDRKPFAVLFLDVEQVAAHAELDEPDRTALLEPAAPIVLLPRRQESDLAREVAPRLGSIGAFLAYTPFHRALVRAVGRPLIATSGNETNEPMPVGNHEARETLTPLADALVLHDRRILRHADDSVVRSIGGAVVPIRIGRGLAPVRIELPFEPPPILAAGGHLKAAVAFTRGRELFLGQHIGDLDTPRVRRRYEEDVADLARLLGVEPAWVAHDLHPEYFSTRFAEVRGLPRIAVQHHVAHVMACLAEHGERGPALGISWDGTGYGTDGTIWGGEFLVLDGALWQRFGSLWPFPLVGGDRAAKEPRRAAAGVCHVAGVPVPEGLRFPEREQALLDAAMRRPAAAQTTTSAGRLFDAWAAFLGLVDRSTYEAEAAMRLEDLADREEPGAFEITLRDHTGADGSIILRLDWRGWVGETLERLGRGEAAAVLAATFHNALAAGSLEMARRAGLETVVLTGGCFQNRLLAERTHELLLGEGFRVLVHRRVPPGDGGLAVGQAWAAALQLTSS